MVIFPLAGVAQPDLRTADPNDVATLDDIIRAYNSIQLTWDGERWWILSWFFDVERDDNPIPAEFLPGEGN